MSTEELNYYRAAASLSLIPTEDNPIFILSDTNNDLLVEIVNGKIDCIEMARMELANRGRNKDGRFIGWNQSSVAEAERKRR